MVVRLWGVRGSIAVSGGAFVRTGGNTTCVEVTHQGHRLILDGGTGLQALGASIQSTEGALERTTLLFSHLHWDHVQGVPFFGPAYQPGTELPFWGPAGLEDALAQQMRTPMFPVGLDALTSRRSFRDLEAGESHQRGPFTVHTSAMTHPDGVLVYRVETDTPGGRRVLVFATDVEHGEALDPRLVAFARGADLLIHDAQYTDEEYPGRRGWGHSTWQQAVRVAEAADVGELVFCHHDPGRTDEEVALIEAAARRRRRSTVAGREGWQVEL